MLNLELEKIVKMLYWLVLILYIKLCLCQVSPELVSLCGEVEAYPANNLLFVCLEVLDDDYVTTCITSLNRRLCEVGV